MLSTFERNILRRIYGPIQDEECWHPTWNGEIDNLYKVLNIVNDIKIRRLGWAGCTVRMVDERIAKTPLMGNFIIQDQWENHEQDDRKSSGRSHHRS